MMLLLKCLVWIVPVSYTHLLDACRAGHTIAAAAAELAAQLGTIPFNDGTDVVGHARRVVDKMCIRDSARCL